MNDRLATAASRLGRDAAYLGVGLATSMVAMAVWVAGISVVASLALFIVGIPAIVVTAAAFRWTADLDRQNAERMLGAPLQGTYLDHGGPGLPARVRQTIADPQTWRDLIWLVLHSFVGFAFATAAATAVAGTAGIALLPLWYQTLPDGADLGLWKVDTLGGAIATMPLAIPAGALALVLVHAFAVGEARLAAKLLGPPNAPAPVRTRQQWVGGPAALSTHGAGAALIGFICTFIWGLTSRGYFWPAWVWLGLGISVALHTIAIRAGDDVRARFRTKVELCALASAVCVAVWALAGGGYPWPVWPVLGMGTSLALRGIYVFRVRVDELTRTRSGALDVQAAELRRIERDLHDGAQARLVSLSMLMGRAEERLAGQPEVADLMRQAREEAGAAIAELRDLARGIAPPVLADRGLGAAVQSLAERAPIDVAVAPYDGGRLAPVVESAAYFVVAEALTNAAKHAGAPARVRIDRRGARLLVEVSDDGPGGADPSGSGLTGLRHRVEALDGTLHVESPSGRGTTIRAELPCGS